MAYKHGVIVSEVPTTVLPPVEVSAAIRSFLARLLST